MTQGNTPQTNWFKKHKILTGIMAFILFGSVINVMQDPEFQEELAEIQSEETSTPEEVAPPEPEYIQISAQALQAAYDNNQVAADLKYGKEKLEITGSVESIGRDIFDNMYVTLNTGVMFSSIQCMLKDSELEKAANLYEGQSITMKGEKPSFVIGVTVQRCEIL